jgi:hypothetical protein
MNATIPIERRIFCFDRFALVQLSSHTYSALEGCPTKRVKTYRARLTSDDWTSVLRTAHFFQHLKLSIWLNTRYLHISFFSLPSLLRPHPVQWFSCPMYWSVLTLICQFSSFIRVISFHSLIFLPCLNLTFWISFLLEAWFVNLDWVFHFPTLNSSFFHDYRTIPVIPWT